MKLSYVLIVLLVMAALWGCDNPYESDDAPVEISYNVYFRENGREKLQKYLDILHAGQILFEENYDSLGELNGNLFLEIRRSVFLKNQSETKHKQVADKLSLVIVSCLHNPEDYDSLKISFQGMRTDEKKELTYFYKLAELSSQDNVELLASYLSPDSLMTLAREAAGQLNYTLALEYLDILLEEHEDFIPGLEFRAQVYVWQKEYFSAIFQYDELIVKDSTQAWYYIENAKAHIELEYFADALPYLDKAIVYAADTDPEPWFLRGKVHYLQAEPDSALADLAQAVERNSGEAYYYRGLIRKESFLRKEACEEFRLAEKAGFYSSELGEEIKECDRFYY
ncbi:MAG: hypothetical protein R3C61_26425 [Bacteroidia bacterium]